MEFLKKHRPITIRVNRKFEFTTDERVVSAASGLLQQMIQGDKTKETYEINLPCYEEQYLESIIIFLKTNYWPGISDIHAFPSVLHNGSYLQCKRIVEDLADRFCESPLEIVRSKKFFDLLSESQFISMMREAEANAVFSQDIVQLLIMWLKHKSQSPVIKMLLKYLDLQVGMRDDSSMHSDTLETEIFEGTIYDEVSLWHEMVDSEAEG